MIQAPGGEWLEAGARRLEIAESRAGRRESRQSLLRVPAGRELALRFPVRPVRDLPNSVTPRLYV